MNILYFELFQYLQKHEDVAAVSKEIVELANQVDAVSHQRVIITWENCAAAFFSYFYSMFQINQYRFQFHSLLQKGLNFASWGRGGHHFVHFQT